MSNYNWHDEWSIPVAPEACRRDRTLFGDEYSDFNAGKILVYLEGVGGLKYSSPENILLVRPALPDDWEWMEIRLPLKGEWTTIRYEKDTVDVSGSPLSWEQISRDTSN